MTRRINGCRKEVAAEVRSAASDVSTSGLFILLVSYRKTLFCPPFLGHP